MLSNFSGKKWTGIVLGLLFLIVISLLFTLSFTGFVTLNSEGLEEIQIVEISEEEQAEEPVEEEQAEEEQAEEEPVEEEQAEEEQAEEEPVEEEQAEEEQAEEEIQEINETIDPMLEETNETVDFILEETNDPILEETNDPILEETNETLIFAPEFEQNLTEQVNNTEDLIGNSTLNLVNFTVISNVTSNNSEIVSEVLVQFQAEINKPVQWEKTIVLENETFGLEININPEATNISVIEIEDSSEIDITDETIITEDTVALSSFGGVFNWLFEQIKSVQSITGFVTFVNEEELTLTVNEPVEEIVLEYYTDAPQIFEETIDNGKKIIISSNQHYTNILSYTNISEDLENNISFYWIVNETRIPHNFTGYDTNNNSLIDFIEWITPHTSNETFEEVAGVQGDYSDCSDENGNVTISTDTTWTQSYVCNNVSITSNAVLTFDSTAAGNKSVNLTANALTIEPGSEISALNTGYPSAQGPGAATGGVATGGSYGGSAVRSKGPYGSIIEPLDMGSGGGSSDNGAGAIFLNISGNLVNNGIISANVTTSGWAGSAGGSVYIITDSLSGVGTISAAGGAATNGGRDGGGGGRIAIYYNTNTLTGKIAAEGGPAATTTYRGGAGTVYLKDKSQDYGSLYVVNNPTFITDEETIINSTFVGGDHIVDLVIANGSDVSINSYLNTTTISVLNDSKLTHSANGELKNYSLNMSGVNLTLDSSSSIDVLGKGFSSGNGPGAGTSSTGGGSYGGSALSTKGPYGSIIAPYDLGSGAGTGAAENGGGAIFLNISDTLINNGIISANATTSALAGSSGGSIYLITNTLTGSGHISAAGGEEITLGSRDSGGGGRIAIYYATNTLSGNIAAEGGESVTDTFRGGAGTVYLKDKNQDYGSLYVVNNVDFTTDEETIINSSFLDGNHVIDLVIVNGSDVNVDSYLNTTTIRISNYSKLKHSANGATAEFMLNITGVNITIDNSSSINVYGRGYLEGFGPGVGSVTDAGGSYGGTGGVRSLGVYGSLTTPYDIGSGAQARGNSGGGAIFLNLSGVLRNEGQINANGTNGGEGGGSGGGIYVIANTIDNLGLITAGGGTTTSVNDGGGGGGRIALYFTNGDFSVGRITNVGGANPNANANGEPGSIFLCDFIEGVSCSGSGGSNVTIANGSISVVSMYDSNVSMNVSKIINPVWSAALINWSDNSTNSSLVATHAVFGLTESVMYTIYDNGVENSTPTTDSSGEVAAFSLLVGSTSNDIALVRGNVDPTKLSSVLNISTVYTDKFVNVSVTYSDSDSDVGTVYFNLSVNGTFVASNTQSSIASGNNINWIVDPANWTKNDNLSFWSQSFDGTSYSGLNTTNITVNNSIPTVSSVLLNATSSANKTTDDLVAHITSNDLDSDSLTYHFVWYINESVVYSIINATGNTSVLGTGNYSAGDIANLTVIANDGQGNSTLVWSNNLTLIIANTGSNAPKSVLNASTVYTNTFLNVSVNYTDPNGDTGIVYFNLTANDTIVASETFSNVVNGSSVSWIVDSTNWSKNDNLSFWVQSYDGTVYSGLNTTNITVNNSLPVIRNALLNASSLNNYTTNDLLVNVSADDNDGDSLTYHFLWYTNNVFVASSLNSTGISASLGSENTEIDDIVNVSIIANDGTDNSSLIWANNILIAGESEDSDEEDSVIVGTEGKKEEEPEEEEPTIFFAPLLEEEPYLEKEELITVFEGDSFDFEIESSFGDIEEHIMIVNGVDKEKGEVLLEFRSSIFIVELSVGDTKKMDLDSNGVLDIAVTLKEIKEDNSADISIDSLQEDYKIIMHEKNFKLDIYSILFIVFICLIVLLLVLSNFSKKE
jgi:outer membrane biosynthesis protein TonB